MEKLFENKTTYTKDTYMEFLRFHTRIFNAPYMAYTIFWSAVFMLCIYLSFSIGNRLQGVLITIILIGFVLYRVYRPKRVVDKELESDKISSNNINTFSFYNGNFTVENKNGSFSFRYFMLYRVFETDKYFYLYVNKENAFLLSKKTFSKGTAEEFSEFIKKKCRFKYRLKNRK